MQLHYIENFMYHYDMDCLDYYTDSTLNKLNSYIRDNVDTSYWNRGDMVRVSLEKYGCYNWDDNIGLYFWNGHKVIFPFYNGALNYYGSNEYEIDQQVNRFGFVPNQFQFIRDYEPEEAFVDYGLMCSKVLFTNLSNYYNDICDSYIQHYAGDSILSIGEFYANGRRYFLMFFGDMSNDICNYLQQNRPYDFDVDSILDEYNCGINIYDIYDMKGSDSNDAYFFIHPNFLDINFNKSNCNKYNEFCSQSHNKSRKSKGKKYVNEINYASKNVIQKHKCKSVTNKGVSCSRLAREGSDYCGIHDNQTEVIQCASVTAKGIQCNREAKSGYSYCSIHLKKCGY